MFEVALDCLHSEHMSAMEMEPDNVNSSLKASLSIQTVIYLLGRLHKAFAVSELDEEGNISDGALSLTFYAEGWRRLLLGDQGLEKGLLGRAFIDIQEREQGLRRKIQCLNQAISSSQL
jgi:hypothetical protein